MYKKPDIIVIEVFIENGYKISGGGFDQSDGNNETLDEIIGEW